MITEVIVGSIAALSIVALYKGMKRLEANDNTTPVMMVVDPDTDVTQHFTWITPTLAVGSFAASVPPQCWKHFDAILNVSMSEHDGIATIEGCGRYEHIGFPDREVGPFQVALPRCLEILEELQARQLKTLVHCMAGASRSVSVVAAYLHKSGHHDELEQVLAEMKKLRWQVEPYDGFVQLLRSLKEPQGPQGTQG